jgi:hypothetical protein
MAIPRRHGRIWPTPPPHALRRVLADLRALHGQRALATAALRQQGLNAFCIYIKSFKYLSRVPRMDQVRTYVRTDPAEGEYCKVPRPRSLAPPSSGSGLRRGRLIGLHRVSAWWRWSRPAGHICARTGLIPCCHVCTGTGRAHPTRHGIPPGMVSSTACYPARHGIPRGMVSRTAWLVCRCSAH